LYKNLLIAVTTAGQTGMAVYSVASSLCMFMLRSLQ